ncbi:cytochrome C [Oryzomonas sagensis]|uniref:Cytochrome C n=1 Tax=Oryzomonas sagensis TaxID=2603857 RepID=A0ABQ6TLH0_9BACT|nr:cytochrome C [Oryzomonas sagensis]
MRVAFLLLAVMLAPATAVTYAETCVTSSCHIPFNTIKNMHQPVKECDCLSCHLQKNKEHPFKGGKSFDVTAKGSALCSQCHDAMGKKKVVHSPVKDGDCLSCHKPHGANGRFLLGDSEDQTVLCLGCHDSAPFSRKYVHGPVASGSCTTCHDPHQSDAKSLLKGASREVCLACHAHFAKKMQAAAIIHPPVKKEPCTSCHDPHSSAWPNLLKRAMPDLCTGCHKETGKKIKNSQVPHKPVIEGKLCANCHTAHFSKARGLLLADDEKSACLGCHNTDKLGDPALSNIKKELDVSKHLHGPIQKGRCSGCHSPHGSDFPHILAGNYPSDFYVAYNDDSYSLCTKCHDKNLFRFAETTLYTKFRNGSRNLHYVHVNSSKGRSCRACHEPHASNGPKLVSADGARFGQWRIKSRFQLTPTGGSCAPGCHRRFRYDRITPFDLNATTQK